MPNLLSGRTLRSGGSGEFLKLAEAQPQLPPTASTLTGFTVVTNDLLQTTYKSSLGFVEFTNGAMYSALPAGNIRILNTGGSGIISVSTTTGLLVVDGDVGVGGTMTIGKDIIVNGITVGQGYKGLNNIVLRGTASPQINAFENGQESIAIGYDVLQGIQTSYKNIAIGRYALSSGTNISNNIAVGDSALKQVGILQVEFRANITGITLGTITNITSPGYNIPSGTRIQINSVVGTTQLNGNYYYLGTLTNNTFVLYQDAGLSVYTNSTGFGAYVSGGTVSKVLENDNNTALGNSAGEVLKDGSQNVFIGHEAGISFTTGSNNIIIGSGSTSYLITGSGIISIGGDNIVNGLNDQVNIGSVFYYDGDGYATVNAETTLGLGSHAQILSTGTFTSTSTVTGGAVVVGGIFVYDNAIVGTELSVLGSGTSTFATSVKIQNTTQSISSQTGSLVVEGGLSVKKRIRLPQAVMESSQTLVSTTASTIIDTFQNTEFRSAEYLIQIDEGIGASSDFELRKILLIADNAGAVWATEFGVVTSGSYLGNFTAAYTGTTVSLYFTAFSTSSKTVKVFRTGITA